jgi:hypothetical protein
MMNEWGIPTFYLEALAYQFCRTLSDMGMRVPDIAMTLMAAPRKRPQHMHPSAAVPSQ